MTKKENKNKKDITPPSKEKKGKAKSKKQNELIQLNEKVQVLEAQVSDLNEKTKEKEETALRSLAELENFKKRKDQEKADFIKFSNERFVGEILPVLDSFKLATEQTDSNEVNIQTLKEGIVLIQKQLDDVLKKMNVEKIDALSQKFDPNMHQAIGHESKKGVEENIVIKEMQTGYTLNGRVVRPSMVVVSS